MTFFLSAPVALGHCFIRWLGSLQYQQPFGMPPPPSSFTLVGGGLSLVPWGLPLPLHPVSSFLNFFFPHGFFSHAAVRLPPSPALLELVYSPWVASWCLAFPPSGASLALRLDPFSSSYSARPFS